MSQTESMSDLEVIKECEKSYQKILDEIGKVIVGQRAVIDDVLMALFCDSHILLVGVPGLAKTLLLSTLAQALDLEFKRVQFTPDLLPGDITGSEVIEENRATGRQEFRFVQGPVFTNLLLADEINRTPPKTQAALLQAMQEREVTIGRETMKLERPFFVMATQNPIEQEGTYPLPEAQLDRFMFNTYVDYPSNPELVDIVNHTTTGKPQEAQAAMGGEEILRIQKVVLEIPVAQPIVEYLVRLTAASRPRDEGAPPFVRDYVTWGCGPRAAQYLALGAKARAMLHGNAHASVEDVRTVAISVMRHRIGLNFNARADGVDTVQLVQQLLEAIPTNV